MRLGFLKPFRYRFLKKPGQIEEKRFQFFFYHEPISAHCVKIKNVFFFCFLKENKSLLKIDSFNFTDAIFSQQVLYMD